MNMKRAGLTLCAVMAEPGQADGLSTDEWQGVLTLARAERIDALLDTLLTGVRKSIEVHTVLAEAARRAAKSRASMRWEVDRIEAATRHLVIPILLLKGAAHCFAGSSAAEGRFVGDVDILVPHAALPDVEAALLAAGWVWAKSDPYDDGYYRRWMHELPPLIHAERGQMVDVHHTLLPLTAHPSPDPERLLARAVGVPGTALLVPAVSDRLIHAAAHLLADGELEGGLRNLWDIKCLAEEVASADLWDDLRTEAARHGLSGAVERSLRLSGRLFGTSAPVAVTGRARASDRLFERRLLARDGWGRPRRPLTRLAFAVRGHLLRMPLRLLLPHLARKWWRQSRASTASVNSLSER